MKRHVATTLAVALLAVTASAAAPAPSAQPIVSPLVSVDAAAAQTTKSRGEGTAAGGNVSKAGDRLGELLAGWAVPVLTVIAGCLLIAALASRNVGSAVGIVVITLLGLIFLLAPESIESMAKGIAAFVF